MCEKTTISPDEIRKVQLSSCEFERCVVYALKIYMTEGRFSRSVLETLDGNQELEYWTKAPLEERLGLYAWEMDPEQLEALWDAVNENCSAVAFEAEERWDGARKVMGL